MSALEKFASFIGFLGFAMLVPGIMYALGNPSVSEFLSANLGTFGDASVMTSVAFVLIAIAIFFGGGENITGTLLGMVIGFFFISTAVEVGFMEWFRDFASSVSFMGNLQLNYLVGIAVVFLGLLFSFSKKIKFLPQAIILVALPVGFVVAANNYGWFQYDNKFSLSMDKGFEDLSHAIDEKYRSMPAVVKFIEDLQKDEELSEEQKEEKMQDLNQKIGKMEDDTKTLEELRKENEEYRKLLEEQKQALKGIGWCTSSKDTSHQTKGFTEAVVPDQPCVRDFAVSLVKNESGPYSERGGHRPGKNGIRQIAALHVHLSSNWKYINDPTQLYKDYFSRADRTLALGMAGDCDDYSILMASCVEAISGKARIMGGQCSRGGHAWAEVLIGDQQDWSTAVDRLRKFYRKNNKQFTPSVDSDGYYWLPLDWRIGEYTCNDDASELEELYGPDDSAKKQLKQIMEEQRNR